jgi:hypothetical protein
LFLSFCMNAISGSPGGHLFLAAKTFENIAPGDLLDPGERLRLVILRELPTDVSDRIVAYADGSAICSGAGAAAVCQGLSISMRLSPLAGPLIAEVVAIMAAALEFAPDVIVSDSLNALHLVADGESRHQLGSLCHSILVVSGCVLVWQPRCSSPSLCAADELARFASRHGRSRWAILADAGFFKKSVLCSLSCLSDLTPSMSRLRLFIVPDGRCSYKYSRMGLIGTPARLVAGMVPSPSLMHKWGRRSSPACVCGADDGHPLHLLLDCPLAGEVLCVGSPPFSKEMLVIMSERLDCLNSLNRI